MEQIDIEKLLQEGKIVQTKLRGYSMYPLFVPGREDVRIESCRQDSLHRGDVVLYRRTGGRLVLHRIHQKTENTIWWGITRQKLKDRWNRSR